MVRPDFYRVPGSFQKVSPFFQRADDSEHLLVMDLVISFHWREGLAVKGYRVPLFFSGQSLRKNGSGGEVRTVSLDVEGLRVLR